MNGISTLLKQSIQKYKEMSLVVRILIGMLIGVFLAFLVPGWTWIGELGNLFVGALKGIAPVLVFTLVSSSLAQNDSSLDKRFGTVIALYLITTLLAAILAIFTSRLFPQTIALGQVSSEIETAAPQGLEQVFHTLLENLVTNPVASIAEGNYIGILTYAVLFGFAMKVCGSSSSKLFMKDISQGVSTIVRWFINLAPFGILGLIFTTVSTSGLSIFTDYGKLLVLLAGTMLFMALVVSPLVIFVCLRVNPYPLVFRCLKESGIPAFFTRSSAANIPVNMELCRQLGLDENFYSVSIPLGSTINMDGAAITITVMTLTAANTMGIQVSLPAAILLSVVSTLAACGTSGVAGGSLLLIPMACSLFGITQEVAMQVVAVGFIIGVVQDSIETALNSSSDVEFTATAEYMQWRREGKPLPLFLRRKKSK